MFYLYRGKESLKTDSRATIPNFDFIVKSYTYR